MSERIMTREIKFRAWDIKNEKYIYSGIEYALSVLQLPDDAEESQSFIGFNDYEWRHFIIEQFTGLHDKNGKEIYEGDIVITQKGHICSVIFDNGSYHIDRPGTLFKILSYKHWPDIEVIGNVHEHPELLTEKQED